MTSGQVSEASDPSARAEAVEENGLDLRSSS